MSAAFGVQNTNPNPLQPQPSNLFGSTTAPTSLFGGGSTTNANANTNTPAQGAMSIFGNPGTQNPLFGGTGTSTTTSNPANTAGGLFGASTTNTGINTQQTQPTTNPNFFGNTTGSNLFGSKPAGTNLFGSIANNPLFGGGQQPQQQPQQQQQQTQQQTQQTNPLFGSTNKSNFLTSRPAVVSQPHPADVQQQFQKLLQSIEAIYSAWNPQSRDCRFQYPFYNLVDPKQVNLYARPQNATNDALWEKALRENPDPSCLVPVIANGFDDLRVRVDAQSTQSASHLQRLKDIQSRLDSLRTQHSVSNASRISRATALQIQLSQRVLHLVQHLHLLIPSVRSSALRPEEEALRGKLEEVDEDLRRGRVKGRLNELWALIGAIGAGSERAAGNAGTDGGGGGGGDWAVVDEEGLAQIAQILSEQQAGLQHLTRILQKGLKDLGVVMGTKGGAGSMDDGEAVGENSWMSRSTLRASALR